jgi:antitoxin component YwqK of YwqJK toxin-antitoxin module
MPLAQVPNYKFEEKFCYLLIMKMIFPNRYFLFSVILLLSFSCYSGSEKKNSKDSSLAQNKVAGVKDTVDWKSLQCDSIIIIPKGKIKSITYCDYPFEIAGQKYTDSVDAIVGKKSCNSLKTTFDSTGKILQKGENPNSFDGALRYFYENGKLVKLVDTEAVMEEDYYRITSYCLFQYDQVGNLIKTSGRSTWYRENGKKEEHQNDSILKYDKNNNVIERRSAQYPSRWIKYEYDSLNRLTKETESENGNLYKHEYYYNMQGRKVEDKFSKNGKNISVHRYCYYESGTVKEDSTIDNKGVLTMKGICYYDKFGNQIYSEWYYSLGEQSSSKGIDKWETRYIYDEKGNWTRKDTYHNGKPWEVEKRDIEYY